MADEWEVKSVEPASEWDVVSVAPAASAAPAATAAPTKPPTMDVVQNALYSGVAAVPDMLLNAPNQAMNLVRAASGSARRAMGGGSESMPELTENPDLARKALEKMGLIKGGVEPQGMQKAIDVVLRGGMAGALTGGSSIPRSLIGAGLGATASGAGAGTEALSKGAGASESTAAALGQSAGLLAPKGVGSIAAVPRMATQRGAQIPPERVDAYRRMTEEGARPSGGSLIYGEANKNVAGQQRVANEMWNESVGLPKKQDFGLQEIDAAHKNLSNDYNRLLTGREVQLDKPMFDKIKSLYDEQAALSQPGVMFSEARPIIDALEKMKGMSQSGTMKIDALEYNRLRSILGKDAQRSKADANRSGLLWKMQEALDKAADRSMPDISDELGVTRGRYENLMILSDAMVGKGPGFVTPAQIGKEVARRGAHRSLYPNQTPLKELGRQGLSLSGDASQDVGVNLSGMAAHVPKGGISLNAIERALATPLTAVRARGMAAPGMPEKAKEAETAVKQTAKRAALPVVAAKEYDDAEKEAKYQAWKKRQKRKRDE